jgi:hypothetical protein
VVQTRLLLVRLQHLLQLGRLLEQQQFLAGACHLVLGAGARGVGVLLGRVAGAGVVAHLQGAQPKAA